VTKSGMDLENCSFIMALATDNNPIPPAAMQKKSINKHQN